MSPSRCSLLAAVVLLLPASQAMLTFLSGPLQNASYTVVPTSLYLGPQSVDVTAAMVALPPMVDSCDPGDIKGLIADKVVIINEGACSPERQYAAMVANGPAAIVALTMWKPGGQACYLRDGDVPGPQRTPYLQLTFDPALIPTFLPGPPIYVRVRADRNPWKDLYDSVVYQIMMRWIPVLLFGTAAVLAWTFLYRHYVLVRDKYHGAVPAQARTAARLAQFLRQNLTSIHAALLLQGVTTTAVCVVHALDGYQSSSRVPGPVQRFFSQNLSGYALIAIQIVSGFWNRVRQKAMASSGSSATQTLLARALTSQMTTTSALWYAIVLANELATTVLMATYAMNKLMMPALILLQLAVVAGIVVIGAQFVVSVVRFWTLIRSAGSSATTDYARRMSRQVLLLGTTLLVQVLIRVLALNPDNLQPGPFFVTFVWASWTHAASCILVALLMQPRARTADTSTAKTGTTGVKVGASAAPLGKPSEQQPPETTETTASVIASTTNAL